MFDETNIPEINLENYYYNLPQDRIAQFPEPDRSNSKFLLAKATTGEISHHRFSEIHELIPENSLLIINSTKVIAARLLLRKESGGKAEILCVEPVKPNNDPQLVMAATKSCTWKCIIGGKKIIPGMVLSPEFAFQEINLNAIILERNGNEAIVEFFWKPESESFASVLEELGNVPLPPYIKRDADENDKDRYQTIYAQNDGSVAAPTAGLHFTDEIIQKLKDKNIPICEVSLHVGPGTFKPIEESIQMHDMHSEQIFVNRKSIEMILSHLKTQKSPIIATGTTSLRAIESLYWFGMKLLIEPEKFKDTKELFVEQWDPYNITENSQKPHTIVLEAILHWMYENQIEILTGKTKLFIVPGYEFKIVNGLITNYHIPKSTLILLVAAFLGDKLWRQVYEDAMRNGYRFLSYGDASILFK
jgi:S-adenosylmethionine:tRNA ribosyltransferase-isomerase